MIEIKEQIEVNKFNSKRLGLYLLNRDAPTPEEKEIIEDLPYSQGVLDFSMIMGERMFDNRTLTRSEEHTSELQSRFDLVCRLLLEKKNHGNIDILVVNT